MSSYRPENLLHYYAWYLKQKTNKKKQKEHEDAKMIGDSDKRPNNLGTMNDVTQDRGPHAIMYSNHGWSKYVNFLSHEKGSINKMCIL